ncbi:BTAD domain-containing putative transcriptional regulator [Actinomadura sp. DC4]|uniref:AfsR/SARP family transcriptional regulator n=1 Tax=Actinomadura sp. DC4 TaxID=3055069 RepID=UPI0025B12348|nr:BTAD domain-containing putative transcriptional regulator [Actinomadura sp. DC4]MDN3355648.1 BTAD domain-containing putative transcriptional regulator [Actinomadura sp. DC4]
MPDGPPPIVTARILGPLDVRVGERPVRIPAGRQQTTLALLLLNRGNVVGIDRLVDTVWADPPPTAVNQIAICVSRLRAVLAGAPVIMTVPPGYRLVPELVNLDLDTVDAYAAAAEEMALAGDGRGAAARLRKAVGLWRGSVLEGMASAVLRPVVARWDERRLTLIERYLELELEYEGAEAAIGELTALVAAHPLRERLRCLLMSALYRGGRQSDALAVFRAARDLLVEQVGVEPGPELRATHEAILRGTLPDPEAEPRPVAVPARPRMLPHDLPDFTGRTEQVRELAASLRPAGRTDLAIVAVSGPGGVGKTALAVRVAHTSAGEFHDGQLYADLGGLGRAPREPREVLGHFLRHLGADLTIIPAGGEERAEMYRHLLAGRRVLVVLDNAHDETQVQPLLPGDGPAAALITSRFRLTGLSGAAHVELGVFSDEQAVALLYRTLAPKRVAAEAAEAVRLAALCGRLPLALRIAASRLAAKPHWTLADLSERLSDERRRLDELTHGSLAVRSSIALSYRALGPRAARLFRCLGLLNAPDFAASRAAPMLGVPPEEAADLMEQLVDARLLEATGRDAAYRLRYRFHDLVRVYARERAWEIDGPERCRETIGALLVPETLSRRPLLGPSCEPEQALSAGP